MSTTTTAAVRADLYALRGQLVQILDRQKLIVDAMADVYAYRKANDTAVVTIYGAVLWLARKVTGRVLG